MKRRDLEKLDPAVREHYLADVLTDERQHAEFITNMQREADEQDRRRQALAVELRAIGATDSEIGFIDENEKRNPLRDLVGDMDIKPDAKTILQHARAEIAAARAERRAALRGALLRSGAPELHLKHVFDVRPDETDAIKFVREFLHAPATFLILSSAVGVGKTAAAVWGLSRLPFGGSRLDYLDARFVTMAALRDLFGYEKEQRKGLDEIERTGLLIIDELPHEAPPAYVISGLDALINERYAACRKTVITTNVNKAQFTIYGDRVYDRMRECGEWCDVAGESRRGRP